MAQLNVLISGAGIAGNALAFWLSHLGHKVTVIERFPSLRTTGLQVDLRGPGIEVLRRMGLEGSFRARSVQEQGLRIVDHRGKQWAFFPANRSGKGLQSFTTDFEIMRRDLCHLLYDATKDRVTYRFGVCIQHIHQTKDSATVLFSDATSERFDLVVGADGQGSRTRRMILDSDTPDPFFPLGNYAGYFTMPRELEQGENNVATAYLTTRKRFILTRRHDPHEIQAYLMCEPQSDQLLQSAKGEADKEKQGLAEVFRGAGWEADQIISGLGNADDFYCERMGIVRLDCWSRGRVVLVGDAAYCTSAMTGMGTTSAFVGSYILAGEISRHFPVPRRDSNVEDVHFKSNLDAALKAYEDRFRPFIDQVQRGLSEPSALWERIIWSPWGIAAIYLILAVVSWLHLDIISRWALREDIKDWEFPEYPDMVRGLKNGDGI